MDLKGASEATQPTWYFVCNTLGMVVISIPTTISKEISGTAFAACLDTKSTVMLEFQGVVEKDGSSWAGNALGQLSILEGVTGLPTIHHDQIRIEAALKPLCSILTLLESTSCCIL